MNQAIVDGEPPDLPEEGYSEGARNFVRGCLNKIPNLRPTYAMLLQHMWLAPLVKPETITEEDEEAAEAAAASQPEPASGDGTDAIALPKDDAPVVDQEVADWVKEAIEKRKKGILGKAPKPALHAAPLDAVSSPSKNKPNGLDQAAPETAA